MTVATLKPLVFAGIPLDSLWANNVALFSLYHVSMAATPKPGLLPRDRVEIVGPNSVQQE